MTDDIFEDVWQLDGNTINRAKHTYAVIVKHLYAEWYARNPKEVLVSGDTLNEIADESKMLVVKNCGFDIYGRIFGFGNKQGSAPITTSLSIINGVIDGVIQAPVTRFKFIEVDREKMFGWIMWHRFDNDALNPNWKL